MQVLVTGNSGLIGAEAMDFFDRMGFSITDIDINMRADFFGPQRDTSSNRQRPQRECGNFRHLTLDIRDRSSVDGLFAAGQFELIIQDATQCRPDSFRLAHSVQCV